MRSLQLLVTFVVALAITVFSTQNSLTISIQFLWLKSVQLPLGFVAVFAVGAGICSSCLGLTALTHRAPKRAK